MNQHKTHPSPVGVQDFLKGTDYPARNEDLISTARGNDAPRKVMDLLQKLPGDRYDGPDDVMRAYGAVR
jgi:Protein of unknown function (DUF2795)